MNEMEFLNIVLHCTKAYASAIETGAQWEIAAQVFISMELKKIYGVIGREIRYPDSDRKAVDLCFQINQITYAVEIKVESANDAGKFAGVSLNAALNEDADKIRNFNLPGAVKWVVVIAYSGVSKAKIRNMNTQGSFTAIDEEGAFVAGILRV